MRIDFFNACELPTRVRVSFSRSRVWLSGIKVFPLRWIDITDTPSGNSRSLMRKPTHRLDLSLI